ncbi:hypothetical protein [Nannocystis pusilla]|uniref:Uncharacterized protein n=1 Tax=Nannocystis pusilla TaxID=889268 RepID=A0ABS7TX96_9BACT|nr:hypothetical protein [Nannocystis pusilla]MBZ5712883.1 hypothetical protein [Nannocystis pusilla]
MPRVTWSLAALLLACMPPRGAPRSAQEPAAPPASAPDFAAPAPAPVAGATCDYPAEAPARFEELRAAGGPCRAVPARVARELRAEIRERWAREWPAGRLEIRGGCDRLGAQPSSIVIESCEGHGGALTLARFEREASGAYDLVLLEYDHDARVAGKDEQDPWQAHSSGPLAVRRARLDGAVMAPLLERLRAAAHVEIEEHEPPPRKDNSFAVMASGSSHYYHAALRLADDRGRGVQHVFTGHDGTGHDQKLGVPLAIVAEALDTLLADPPVRSRLTELGADDPAARDLFARVFWAARDRGDDDWYVEQLLGMTALLGSAQHVPALVDRLRARGERGVTRTHIVVVNAIAALAGYDVRHDAGGEPRPLASVVADTLAACEKG